MIQPVVFGKIARIIYPITDWPPLINRLPLAQNLPPQPRNQGRQNKAHRHAPLFHSFAPSEPSDKPNYACFGLKASPSLPANFSHVSHISRLIPSHFKFI